MSASVAAPAASLPVMQVGVETRMAEVARVRELLTQKEPMAQAESQEPLPVLAVETDRDPVQPQAVAVLREMARRRQQRARDPLMVRVQMASISAERDDRLRPIFHAPGHLFSTTHQAHKTCLYE